MLYLFTLTVPPNTPETKPLRRRVKLTRGVITRVMILFPPNSAGLLHVAVEDRGSQIWPSNPGEYFLGDNLFVVWDEAYEIEDDPGELVLVGWNEDDSFAHSAYFHFAVLETSQLGMLGRIAAALGVS